jgi:hypothetical protein
MEYVIISQRNARLSDDILIDEVAVVSGPIEAQSLLMQLSEEFPNDLLTLFQRDRLSGIRIA